MNRVLVVFMLFSLWGQSCTTFKRDFDEHRSSMVGKPLNGLDGIYAIRPMEVHFFKKSVMTPTRLLHVLDREKPFWEVKHHESSLVDQVQLKVVEEEKRLYVTFLAHGEFYKAYRLKYRDKGDGYLYLKNRNVALAGIPFYMGLIDVNKVRMTIDDKRNLIVEVNRFSGGGIGFIISDWGRSKFWKTYWRVSGKDG